MNRQIFIDYWRLFEITGNPHACALRIQSMTEHEINRIALGFIPSDHRRQAVRIAARWAKDATTAEVESAIREAQS